MFNKNFNFHFLQLVSGVKWLAIMIITFCSCSGDYVANMVNSPMLKQQGDLQIGVSGSHSGFNGQAAYAINDKVGVMVNGVESSSYYTNNNFSTSHEIVFAEGGGGYYHWFTPNNFFECYGGLGLGEVHNVHTQKKIDITYFHTRAFLQPAIGVSADFFSMSLATRITQAHLSTDSITKNGVFIEPAITAKVRFDALSGLFQMGAVRAIYQSDAEMEVLPFWIGIGLQYNFDLNYFE